MGIGKTSVYVFSYVFFFPYTFLFLSFSFYVHLLYLSSAFSDFVIHLLGFLPSPHLFPATFFSETLILVPILSSPHFFFSFTYVIITLLGFHIILFLFFFHVPLHSLIFFSNNFSPFYLLVLLCNIILICLLLYHLAPTRLFPSLSSSCISAT